MGGEITREAPALGQHEVHSLEADAAARRSDVERPRQRNPVLARSDRRLGEAQRKAGIAPARPAGEVHGQGAGPGSGVKGALGARPQVEGARRAAGVEARGGEGRRPGLHTACAEGRA